MARMCEQSPAQGAAASKKRMLSIGTLLMVVISSNLIGICNALEETASTLDATSEFGTAVMEGANERQLQEETDHTDEDDDHTDDDHDDHDHDEEEETSSGVCSTSEHHHHEEEEEPESGLGASKGIAAAFVLVSALLGVLLRARCPVLQSPKFISYVNVLTGGMFIAMGLFHILPESIEHQPCSLATLFTSEESAMGVVFFVFVGFMMVLFFERVLFDVHDHSKSCDNTANPGTEGAEGEEDHLHVETQGWGAAVLLISLGVHSVFEGIIVGTAESVGTVFLLAGIVVAHKWAAAFAMADRLPSQRGTRIFTQVLLAVFCIASPFGTLLGWWVDSMEADSEGDAASFVKVVLNSIAIGTLFYIGFVEVISAEFSSAARAMPRFCLLLAASAFIFGLTLLHLEYGHHDH